MKHFKYFLAFAIAWMAGVISSFAAVDDTFTANTTEGVAVTYKVLTEDGTTGTVQIGLGTSNSPAIATSTTALTIPATVINGDITYNVTAVANYAFNGCTSLSQLTIEDSNETLTMGYGQSVTSGTGRGLFRDCPLTTVYVGRNLSYDTATKQGHSPFALITTINSFTFGDAVTAIRAQFLRGSTGLTEIVVPNQVQSIGKSAFIQCTSLTSVSLPNSLTSLSSYVFYGCTALPSIELPAGVTTIQEYTFYGCTSLLSVTLSSGLTTIDQNAFYGCTALTSVQIPDAVTEIGSNAFGGCSSLETVTISENSSLTTIGGSAFNGYNKLASIYLPPTVTSIGNQAFRLCTLLESVYISDLAAWCRISFGDTEANPLQNGTDGVDLYLNGTKVENLTFPNDVTTIGVRAFYHCRSLKSVHIPNTIASIGDQAFRLCANLTSMTIAEDNNLESIGLQFVEGTGIPEFSWPSNLTTIGPSVLRGADKLKTVHIPNTVTAIGDYAFAYCSKLENVTIPSGVTTIGSNAFAYCQGLRYVYCDAETAPALGNHAWTSTTDTRYYLGYSRQRLLIYPYGSNYSGWAGVYGSYQNFFFYVGEHFIVDGCLYQTHGYYDQVVLKAVSSEAIHNGVVNIPEYVSYGDKSYYVKWILEGAFEENGSNIERLYVNTNTPPELLKDGLAGLSETCDIYVPSSSVNSYESSWGERDYKTFLSKYAEFTVPVSVTNNGTTSQVDMEFKVTSAGINPTVQVGDGSNSSINSSTAGEIVIPSTVTYEGETFTVTSLSQYAFKSCNNIKKMTIPSTITEIKDYAVVCSSLERLYLESPDPTAITVSNYPISSVGSSCILVVPAGSKAAYQNSVWNSIFPYIKEVGHENEWLPGDIFWVYVELGDDCEKYIPFKILTAADGDTPATVQMGIRDYNNTNQPGENDAYPCIFEQYDDCPSEVTIPGSVEFKNDTYIVTTLGAYAFAVIPYSNPYNYERKNKIILPSSITTIGYKAFNGDCWFDELYVNSETAPTLITGDDLDDEYPAPFGYEFVEEGGCNLFVPDGCLQAYSSWAPYFKNIMEIPKAIVIAGVEYKQNADIFGNGTAVLSWEYEGSIKKNLSKTDAKGGYEEDEYLYQYGMPVLTLNNATINYTGNGPAIEVNSFEKFYIRVKGNNTITAANAAAAISIGTNKGVDLSQTSLIFLSDDVPTDQGGSYPGGGEMKKASRRRTAGNGSNLPTLTITNSTTGGDGVYVYQGSCNVQDCDVTVTGQKYGLEFGYAEQEEMGYAEPTSANAPRRKAKGGPKKVTPVDNWDSSGDIYIQNPGWLNIFEASGLTLNGGTAALWGAQGSYGYPGYFQNVYLQETDQSTYEADYTTVEGPDYFSFDPEYLEYPDCKGSYEFWMTNTPDDEDSWVLEFAKYLKFGCDYFIATTDEGIKMKFTVTNENPKECQVGYYNEEMELLIQAVDQYTDGAVTIPSEANGYAVKSISSGAFYECNNLNSVSIPASVESIGVMAFGECGSLSTVICYATTPPELTTQSYEEDGETYTITPFTDAGSKGGMILYVPAGSVEAYTNAGWGDYFTQILPIGGEGYVFTAKTPENVMLTYMVLGTENGVTNVQVGTGDTQSVVSNPNNWDGNLTIPATVTDAGGNEYKVEGIADYAFCYNSNLCSLTISEGVGFVGTTLASWNGAFQNCFNMTTVIMPSTIYSINNYAFKDCGSLREVYLYATDIPTLSQSDAFSSSPVLYVLDERVEDYQDSWGGEFGYFSKILGMSQKPFTAPTPEGVELTFVILEDNYVQVGTGTGSSIVSVPNNWDGNITVPSTVTNDKGIVYNVVGLGDMALYNDSRIISVTISEGILYIGTGNTNSGVFEYDNNLRTVYLPSTVQGLAGWCFSSCYNICDVYIYATEPPSLYGYGNKFSSETAILHVPAGTKAYYDDSSWAQYFGDGERIVEMEGAPMFTIAMATQMTTFVCDQPLNFEDVEGLKAYIITGFKPSESKLVLTKVDEAPAGIPLLLYRTGATTEFSVPVVATDMYYGENLLKAGPAEITAFDGDKSNFILTYDPNDHSDNRKIGFYTFNNTRTIPAGKAYLQIPTSLVPSSVKGFSIVFNDDEPTAIVEIKDGMDNMEDAVIYDLSGRRVSQIQKGVNIVNGKKVIVK